MFMLLQETLLWLCIQTALIHRFPGSLELRIFVDMLLNCALLSFDISYERTRARSHFIDNKEPVVQNLLSMSWQRDTGKQTSFATFCTGFPPYAFFKVVC